MNRLHQLRSLAEAALADLSDLFEYRADSVRDIFQAPGRLLPIRFWITPAGVIYVVDNNDFHGPEALRICREMGEQDLVGDKLGERLWQWAFFHRKLTRVLFDRTNWTLYYQNGDGVVPSRKAMRTLRDLELLLDAAKLKQDRGHLRDSWISFD